MDLHCEMVAEGNASHHQADDQLLVVDSICILVGSLSTFIGLVMVSSIKIVQVSIGSLIVTFLVYSILPMFHTLHGHVVRMNLISIILFNIALLVIFHATNHLPEVVCTTLGFFTYFCSLAMFSWMTGRQHTSLKYISPLALAVMCFDLLQTFTRAKVCMTCLIHAIH